MNCPACGIAMAERDFGEIQVDVCDSGCKSLWFDRAELARLDEHHEGAGRTLQEALASPRDNASRRGRLLCPKCETPMFEHLYQQSKEVNVDECYNCGGFFLDSGELHQIRETYMSESEREAYRQKLLSESPQFTKAQSALDAEKERTAAILHLTRFFRISYWIDGR